MSASKAQLPIVDSLRAGSTRVCSSRSERVSTLARWVSDVANFVVS